MDKYLTEAFDRIIKLAEFSETCCDKSKDRLWHSEDNTWWRRIGDKWYISEMPSTVEPKKE